MILDNLCSGIVFLNLTHVPLLYALSRIFSSFRKDQNMESSRDIILVTGVNGFIAAVTVQAFLQAGYNVRGTVRSISSGVAIKEALIEYVNAGRFEVVIVPDITAEGAFDNVVKGEFQWCLARLI